MAGRSSLKYIVLTVLCVTCIGAVKFRCDYTYFHKLGWFKYHTIPLIWKDARSMCHLEGGMLASPTTAELKWKMMGLMKKLHIHIGIHSTISKGHFFSIDGIPLVEIPHQWAYDEPDNKNNEENCLVMDTDGTLADVKCDVPRPYLCYRPVSSVDATICNTPDPDYHFFGETNKCYKIHKMKRSFERASFACSAEGGHLIIINNEDELKIVQKLYKEYADGEQQIFAGFHDWGEPGDFRTVHGETLKDAGFDTFDSGQPDYGYTGESCGSVSSSIKLNDQACDIKTVFICEKAFDYPPVCNATVPLVPVVN